MTSADNDVSEVVRATPRGRLLSTLLVALAIALLGFFQWYVLPFIGTALADNPTPQSIGTLKTIFIGFAALAILPAIVMVATGRKILLTGQSPQPDAWVWRDTRIKHGRDASRIGWFCILSGALACLACLGIVAFIWATFDRIVPQHTFRSGVAILQERSATK
jgi:hypothetical protein